MTSMTQELKILDILVLLATFELTLSEYCTDYPNIILIPLALKRHSVDH